MKRSLPFLAAFLFATALFAADAVLTLHAPALWRFQCDPAANSAQLQSFYRSNVVDAQGATVLTVDKGSVAVDLTDATKSVTVDGVTLTYPQLLAAIVKVSDAARPQ